MDLDGLFWIALIVFYFAARVLGSKRNQTGRSPQPASQPRKRERQRDDDLDTALGEIRRALGYPESEPETIERSEPITTSDVSRRQEAAREREDMGRQRAAIDQEQAAERRQRAVREEEEKRRQRRAAQEREAARERDRVVRGQPTEWTTSDGADAHLDRPIAPGLPPLRSTFAEEEAFERVGRPAHREAGDDLQVISPYDVPGKKTLPGIRRRLAGRKSLREAFLLKEILDRPLALRRR